MKVDWLIVGAGLTGATLAERIASQLGQSVLVIDRRKHIGGNVYDEHDEHGILVHKYGPHIFRTTDSTVWQYLSRFTAWRVFQHRVLGFVQGKYVPIPFNFNSINALFPTSVAQRIMERLLGKYPFGAAVPILQLISDADEEIRQFAQFVYDNVFHPYTVKQWGLRPEELDPSVTGRVPIRMNFDDRYFTDSYQAVPSLGYTTMIRNMLNNPNIRILLGAGYRCIRGDVQCERTIYTGPIDEFFDYIHGTLPYRSLRFEFVATDVERFQEVATVNYPCNYDFTRITEPKHFSDRTSGKTVIVYEYPEQYFPGKNEPYYPVPQQVNRERYLLYLREAHKVRDKVLFAGRLANYAYINMAQTVSNALRLWEEEISHG